MTRDIYPKLLPVTCVSWLLPFIIIPSMPL
jgi:hypothetical protein